MKYKLPVKGMMFCPGCGAWEKQPCDDCPECEGKMVVPLKATFEDGKTSVTWEGMLVNPEGRSAVIYNFEHDP